MATKVNRLAKTYGQIKTYSLRMADETLCQFNDFSNITIDNSGMISV
ncbi:hypothetical protein DSUL_30123 [Desulfovibrionales bacterium]